MPDAVPTLHLTIEFVPDAAAADDLATISATEEVRLEAYRELSQQPQTSVQVLPAVLRSGGMLELVQELTQVAATNQPLLAVYIGALVTTITALLKHRRVGKIELHQGERKLLIEDTDRAVVEQLVADFLAPSPAPPTAPTRPEQPEQLEQLEQSEQPSVLSVPSAPPASLPGPLRLVVQVFKREA